MLLLRKTDFLVTVSGTSFDRTTKDIRRFLVSSTLFANNPVKHSYVKMTVNLVHEMSKLSECIGSKQKLKEPQVEIFWLCKLKAYQHFTSVVNRNIWKLIIIYIDTVRFICYIVLYWTTEQIFARQKTYLESLQFGIGGNLLHFHQFLLKNYLPWKIEIKTW
jgi:hypothetical protein